MAVKMTGREFNAFLADPAFWPGQEGETYIEDEEIDKNGERIPELAENAADTDRVVIHGGSVRFPNKADDVSLVSHARAWLKKQKTVFILVETTKDKRDALEAAIRLAGGKIR